MLCSVSGVTSFQVAPLEPLQGIELVRDYRPAHQYGSRAKRSFPPIAYFGGRLPPGPPGPSWCPNDDQLHANKNKKTPRRTKELKKIGNLTTPDFNNNDFFLLSWWLPKSENRSAHYCFYLLVSTLDFGSFETDFTAYGKGGISALHFDIFYKTKKRQKALFL